jgi:hypothetical protein
MLRAYVTFFDVLSFEDGQDVAEYAVIMSVVLTIVVGTIRMIG